MDPVEVSDQTGAWYRHPWAWFVFALPLVSVVACLTMVGIAVKNKDDLVRDDWYKAGRAINQDFDADHRSATMGLSAQLALDPAAMKVNVVMNGTTTDELPRILNLELMHSTRASEDMTVLVTREADGVWRGTVPHLPMGKRHITLEPLLAHNDPARWRLRAPETMFVGEPVALSPAF